MITETEIWQALQEVKDPEVPVLSVTDLGIVRSVKTDGHHIDLIITPTYSGCPAMDTIRMDIRIKFLEKGWRDVNIMQSLSPAWTTDWMSAEGKRKLEAYGIAAPLPRQQLCASELFQDEAVACPRCHSSHTELVSRFGSTACKALYRCLDCHEPFDYFKCH